MRKEQKLIEIKKWKASTLDEVWELKEKSESFYFTLYFLGYFLKFTSIFIYRYVIFMYVFFSDFVSFIFLFFDRNR